MRYHNYSPKQIERKAEELLRQFDEERLYKVKPIDVYLVIQKCLDVPYEWQYLTPDQTILGMTAFCDGFVEVWRKNDASGKLEQHQINVSAGTILIEATLTEQDNRGRENFTVLHEVAHQVLHRDSFMSRSGRCFHTTASRTIDDNKSYRYPSNAIAVIERQANIFAAAFLMPRELVKRRYVEKYVNAGLRGLKYSYKYEIIAEIAEEFSVSKQAMTIRLQELGVINKDKAWVV